MEIRFDVPAETRRPGKAHRYDVFGLKLNRPLMFFKRHLVDTWIGLERDPAVSWYCERPLLINDTPIKRLADFYVIRNEKEEIWFLVDAEELDLPLEEQLGPGFVQWCQQTGIQIRMIDIDASVSSSKWALDNWAHILRELAAFGRYLPVQLADSVEHQIAKPQTLAQLLSVFPSVDPILVKVASFTLLHQGRAVCPSLETQQFCLTMPISAP
jgi:hypothetical protein